MQLHNLKKNSNNRASRQIGRGGKRGTTSGRGTKGQNARAGNKRRPELRDIIKKLPKLRGYRFKGHGADSLVINLREIDKAYTAGEVVNLETLSAKKLVRRKAGQKGAMLKILANGTLSKPLTFEGCTLSATAKAKIEQAGGSVPAIS